MRNKKGQFEQGNKGKPKGAINRTTKEVKELLTNFIYDKVSDLNNIYDNLEDKDKVNLIIHVSKLVLPPSKTENENNLNGLRFDFDNQPIWKIEDCSKNSNNVPILNINPLNDEDDKINSTTFIIPNQETANELKKLFEDEN
jgi:hypothetical protein